MTLLITKQSKTIHAVATVEALRVALELGTPSIASMIISSPSTENALGIRPSQQLQVLHSKSIYFNTKNNFRERSLWLVKLFTTARKIYIFINWISSFSLFGGLINSFDFLN